MEYCLICTSPYFIFSFQTFFILNLIAKSIDLVLPSPKWILSLLLTNQSQMLSKSLFSSFFFQYLYVDRQGVYHQHKKIFYLTACETSLIYGRRSRGSRIDTCNTPLDINAGWANAFPRLTKNVLFIRSIYQIKTNLLNV